MIARALYQILVEMRHDLRVSFSLINPLNILVEGGFWYFIISFGV